MMPEKSQKRKLRSDQCSSQENAEISSQVSDKNTCLTKQDVSYISNKIENRLSKRLIDIEFSQREILRLIENLTSKVDSLSNPTSKQSGPALRFEQDPGRVEDTENNDVSRNLSSNMVTGVSTNQQENNHQQIGGTPMISLTNYYNRCKRQPTTILASPDYPRPCLPPCQHSTAKRTNSSTSRTFFRQASRYIRTSQKRKKYTISIPT